MAGSGATAESATNPERRVDAAIAAARFGEVGLGSLGSGEHFDSGGGGAGGQFVFADLAALNAAITRWAALHERIKLRGQTIQKASDLCNPPADDLMSRYQADAAKDTLIKKLEHNDAMLAYAEGYVQKLTVSRNIMVTTEHANIGRLRSAGGDPGHA